MSSHEPTLFVFGPLERRGIMLGLDGVQLTILGVLLACCLGAFMIGAPFLPVLLVAGAVVAVTIRRVRGRTLVGWGAVAARFGIGRRRWRAATPDAGVTQGEDGPAEPDFDPLRDWPPELRGVEVIEHEYGGAGGRPVGVIACDGGWHGVLRVSAASWALDDLATKEARLHRWASTLSQLARDTSPVTRIQWMERTEPDDGSALVRHLAEELSQVTPLSGPNLDSYRQLLAGAAGETSVAHDVLLVVRIDPSKRRREWKELGGKDEGACRMLMQVLERLHADLTSQGLTVQGVLTPRMIGALIRTSYDPAARPVVERSAVTPGQEGVDPRRAAPAATEVEWDRYRTLTAEHRTFWVEEWPRVPITAQEALADVILRGAGLGKTMSVIFEPIPADQASKAAEQAVAADEADEAIRQKRGFRYTARRRRQAEAARDREAELAAGYAEMRYSGWVTVSAPVGKGLDQACDEVENAAQLSGLRLQACNGEQRSAFAHTLPLCRGLA